MTKKYELKAAQTLNIINQLLDDGIKKISVLIRHSARFFTEESRLEPFMGLTDEGKAFAFDFGAAIRPDMLPQLCSSFMGRCIETAFLIDKGFTQKNNQSIDHNCLERILTPFYVKDIEKAVPLIESLGNDLFLRNWFDNRIDDTVMESPEKTADLLSEFMVERIKHLKKNQIAICVSHDWNIFPLKEFKLGLKHETAGDVGYLEGIVFFEKENNYYMTHSQAGPILL